MLGPSTGSQEESDPIFYLTYYYVPIYIYHLPWEQLW